MENRASLVPARCPSRDYDGTSCGYSARYRDAYTTIGGFGAVAATAARGASPGNRPGVIVAGRVVSAQMFASGGHGFGVGKASCRGAEWPGLSAGRCDQIT